MPLDHDGKIRMDCSSPYAMAGLIALKDRFDVAFANDPDADRHGIVTREAGLLNPNHYLAAAIAYLFGGVAPDWPTSAAVGKTLVSSSIIDRVVAGARAAARGGAGRLQVVRRRPARRHARRSAARRAPARASCAATAQSWTTDKDGLIMCLLAAEMTARTGKDPATPVRRADRPLRRARLPAHRRPGDRRAEAPARGDQPERRAAASSLPASRSRDVSHAAPSGAPLGGVKVVTENGWFAARPSGTEDVYKLYAESFDGEAHLERILEEAQAVVDAALQG